MFEILSYLMIQNKEGLSYQHHITLSPHGKSVMLSKMATNTMVLAVLSKVCTIN